MMAHPSNKIIAWGAPKEVLKSDYFAEALGKTDAYELKRLIDEDKFDDANIKHIQTARMLLEEWEST